MAKSPKIRHIPRVTPCPPHDILTRLGDKWTILVLTLMAHSPNGRLRFSELKNGVEGISQRMLTMTLRALERDGLMTRHFFAEVPPRVEYELTPLGKGLLPALDGFVQWIRKNWSGINQARQDFDSREPSSKEVMRPKKRRSGWE